MAPATSTRSPSALVLLSGGVDSSAVLHLLLSEGWACAALFIDYGQPAVAAEGRAATAIAARVNARLQTVSIDGLLVGAGEIPGRNSLLAAVAFTVSSGGHTAIALGIHAGTPYWDCSPAFAEVTQRAFDAQADGAVRLLTPLIDLHKPEVANLARHLGVHVEETWSCETRSDRPCGECLSCKDRAALPLQGPTT
jgi:7-cyano-7-deazaguanine synthase